MPSVNVRRTSFPEHYKIVFISSSILHLTTLGGVAMQVLLLVPQKR